MSDPHRQHQHQHHDDDVHTPGHHSPTDVPDRIDDDALERAYAFCCELIERLDATVGPDLEKPVEATLLKEED